MGYSFQEAYNREREIKEKLARILRKLEATGVLHFDHAENDEALHAIQLARDWLENEDE